MHQYDHKYAENNTLISWNSNIHIHVYKCCIYIYIPIRHMELYLDEKYIIYIYIYHVFQRRVHMCQNRI
jgi:hypothetical protein